MCAPQRQVRSTSGSGLWWGSQWITRTAPDDGAVTINWRLVWHPYGTYREYWMNCYRGFHILFISDQGYKRLSVERLLDVDSMSG
jgi:hypothetical protein